MAVAPTPGRIKIPKVDQRVEELLLWRDVQKSGIVFAGATAVFIFFQFAKYNVLSLVAYALCAAVIAMPIWRLLGPRFGSPPPQMPRMLSEGLAEAEVRGYVDRTVPFINRGLRVAHRALSGQELGFSGVAAIVLFVAARIAARLSLLGMAYLPVLAAFTLPKVYELRKDEIDRGLDAGRAKVTAVHDKYLAGIIAKIPRAGGASPAESSSLRKQE